MIRFGKYGRKYWKDRENTEEIVKRYGKFGTKASWLVKRYGKYGR